MLKANGNFVLCEPVPEKSSSLGNLGSFFNDDRDLIKLKVVFESNYPEDETYYRNKLSPGDFVYVTSSFSDSPFNKAVFSLNGVQFVRVPHSEVFLTETAKVDDDPSNW